MSNKTKPKSVPKCKNSLKNNLETVVIVVDVLATAVAFFEVTWLTARCCCCGKQIVIGMRELIGPLVSVRQLVLFFSDIHGVPKKRNPSFNFAITLANVY